MSKIVLAHPYEGQKVIEKEECYIIDMNTTDRQDAIEIALEWVNQQYDEHEEGNLDGSD